jgi:hypothetical protein
MIGTMIEDFTAIVAPVEIVSADVIRRIPAPAVRWFGPNPSNCKCPTQKCAVICLLPDAFVNQFALVARGVVEIAPAAIGLDRIDEELMLNTQRFNTARPLTSCAPREGG